MEEKIMISSVLRNFNLKEINESSFSNLFLFLRDCINFSKGSLKVLIKGDSP